MATVRVTQPGNYSGLTVGISPFFAAPNTFGLTGFTATSDLVSNFPIATQTVTFDRPVTEASVTLNVYLTPPTTVLGNTSLNQTSQQLAPISITAFGEQGELIGQQSYNPPPQPSGALSGFGLTTNTQRSFTTNLTLRGTNIRRLVITPSTRRDVRSSYFMDLTFVPAPQVPVSPTPPSPQVPEIIIRSQPQTGNTPVDPVFESVSVTMPVTVYVNIKNRLDRETLTHTVNLNALPATPVFDDQDGVNIANSELQIVGVDVALQDALMSAFKDSIGNAFNTYFDQTRQLKNLLNFGQDRQEVIARAIYDPNSDSSSKILVKLYRPLPVDFTLKNQLWISREISAPVIDKIFVSVPPVVPQRVFLRNPNLSVKVQKLDSFQVNNVTLSQLVTSSLPIATASLNDQLLQQYYTDDYMSAELNVNYANYQNFVNFSSARERLIAFNNKLLLINQYEREINQQLVSSSAFTASYSSTTAWPNYGVFQALTNERINLLRSFDGYERFLYYRNEIPFSGSFSGLPEDPIYQNEDVTWFKSGSLPVAYTGSLGYDNNPIPRPSIVSASTIEEWFGIQMYIADQYDRQNINALRNNVPTYLKRDESSAEFLKFTSLIGHHFDQIKQYIDQMTYIYNRDNDTTTGLSPDVVWNVANALGVELPNQYSVKDLYDFAIGQTSPDTKIFRDVATETWKRFLHNHVHITKTRGTKGSIDALLNIYGVPREIIRIREGGIPSTTLATGSWEDFTENTNVLSIPTGAQVIVSASPVSIEARMAVSKSSDTATNILMQGMSGSTAIWALGVTPLDSTFGTLDLIDQTGAVIGTSNIYPLFDGNYFTVLLKNSGTEINLSLRNIDGDDIAYSDDYDVAGNILANWSSVTSVRVGGLPAANLPGGVTTSQSLDEFRAWNVEVSDDDFEKFARYPGLYNGATATSAKTTLLARMSFTKPSNVGITGSILNEAPIARGLTPTNTLYAFSASLFPNAPLFPYSTVRTQRNVRRYTFNGGGETFVSNKVTIAPPPVFYSVPVTIVSGTLVTGSFESSLSGSYASMSTWQYVSGTVTSSFVPKLRRTKSIMPISTKVGAATQNTNVVGLYFTLTDAINNSIVRSLGNINIHDLIGDPQNEFRNEYPELVDLNEFYWDEYAYNFDYNKFFEFVRGLLNALFIQAQKLVPSRARLLSGIVVEPHLLERSRVARRPIQKEELNYSASIRSVSPEPEAQYIVYQTTLNVDDAASLSGLLPMYSSTLDTTDIITTRGTYDTYTTDINVAEGIQLVATNNYYSADLPLSESLSVAGEFILIDDGTERFKYLNFLRDVANEGYSIIPYDQNNFRPGTTIDIAEYLADAKRIAATLDQEFVFREIRPASDFSDPGSTQYFKNSKGVFLDSVLTQSIVGLTPQTDQGVWTAGTLYSPGDIVLQQNISGPASRGNGVYYICVNTTNISGSDGSTFRSFRPPAVDPSNWRRARTLTFSVAQYRQYRLQQRTVVLNAGANITGSVPTVGVAVPVLSPLPVVPLGYMPYHYKYQRDNNTQFKRLKFLGCKNTLETTVDGLPPFETRFTTGDQLFVLDPNAPIQGPDDNNNNGPILGVR